MKKRKMIYFILITMIIFTFSLILTACSSTKEDKNNVTVRVGFFQISLIPKR